jgi:hypothetical protein
VAFSRNVGANTVIDVFAATTNASDRFLNVYDVVCNGTFVQKAGLATKTWKPDVAGFTSTRNTSDDSFMTAGTLSGGAYAGDYYASTNTSADASFTGPTWSATPASAAATTIPAFAGWFTGDPTSVQSNAELMNAWGGGFTRTNSRCLTNISGYSAPLNSDGATHGIWISHLVVAGNDQVIGVGNLIFTASASIKDGVTGATTQARYTINIPAPSALALLSLCGLASRRRRS